MGLVQTIKFSDLKNDELFRIDSKFHFLNKNFGWNIFDIKCKNLISLKNILTPNYEIFKYEENEEYKGIPTGRGYLNEFGDIISHQIVTKEEHPNRLKYKVNNNCILISSLKGAKTPALSFDFDLSDYVFSNGFYVFEISKQWNKKFILYLLRTKTIKNILDNNIYRGIGISSYSENDLLKIQIPDINLSLQNKKIELIELIEKEIKDLKSQKKEHLEIINDVFSKEYSCSKTLWKEFGKGMTAGTQKSDSKKSIIYNLRLSDINKSCIFRVSSRFHNPITNKLNNILYSKNTILIKNIITKKIQRGSSPKYDDSGNIKVIKTAQLRNNIVDISTCEFVNDSFFIQKEKAHIKFNNVLIASTGKVSIGRIDLNILSDDLIADGHVSILNINENKYNPLFLTFFLRTILGVYQIERDYTGCTNQVELYADEIENFIIPDFDLEHQKQLVNKIKTKIDNQKYIDNKIKNKQDKISKIIEDCISANEDKNG